MASDGNLLMRALAITMAKITRSQQPHYVHMAQYLFVLWFLTILTFSLPQVQAAMSSVDVVGLGAATATTNVTVTEPKTSSVVDVTTSLEKGSYPTYGVSINLNVSKSVKKVTVRPAGVDKGSVTVVYNGSDVTNNGIILYPKNGVVSSPYVLFTNNTAAPLDVVVTATAYDRSGRTIGMDQDFVKLPGPAQPSITVLSPKQGELLYINKPYKITWGTYIPDDNTSFSIFEFNDHGKGFIAQNITPEMAGCSGLVGGGVLCSYEWIPSTVSTTYQVAVARDNSNDIGYSESFSTVPGIDVAFISSNTSIMSGDSSNDDTGTFTIRFKVTANGSNVYVSSLSTHSAYPDSINIGNTSVYVEKSGVAVTGGVSTSLTNQTDDNINSAGFYEIEDGYSETFELTATVQLPEAGTAGYYRVSINGITWSTDPTGSTASSIYNSGLELLKTSYVGLN
jgi:hypothetical protein